MHRTPLAIDRISFNVSVVVVNSVYWTTRTVTGALVLPFWVMVSATNPCWIACGTSTSTRYTPICPGSRIARVTGQLAPSISTVGLLRTTACGLDGVAVPAGTEGEVGPRP